MPWVYSVSSSTPPTYTWSGVNTLNQHCAKVNIPYNGAITQLKVYAAGNGSAVDTRLVLWTVGGAALAQSSTFSMASGSQSPGGQAWNTKSITPYAVSAGNFWVGLYRDPAGGHIFGTTSSGAADDGYRKDNTAGFPAVASMSGYSTHSGREPYVGAFYITSPANQSSQSASRVTDNNISISWYRNADSDQPYYNQYVQRWDNVSGSWSTVHTITTDYTSNGSQSWSDTTTVANRKYRYRIYADNTAGNSSYVYTSYVYTTPDDPSSASVSRVSDTNQSLSWTNASYASDVATGIKVQRYDNVSGNWYAIATLGVVTSYSNTTTVANKRYRYRIYAYNAAGNSGYAYTDYIRTTPAAPSNVVGTRVGSNVEVTWDDNATAETNQTIQRKTSSDGVSWTSYSTLSSSIATDTESYTDTSPANYNKYQVRADCTDPTLNSDYEESNEVVIIQPPDQPSGLTPTDSTAFDGDEAKTFEWTHNPNDGTDQEKFSLKIKISGGTYPKEIDNFSDYSEWTASGSDLADDETNVVTGLGNSVSMADSDDTGSTISMYKAISSIDLTEFDDASASDTSDLISLLVYVSDVSYFSDLTLKLGDDASNYYYTNVDPSASWSNGWNTLVVAKSAFSSTGSPTGWDDISYIRIDVTTENNASGENVSVQYLQLADVTDYTSYAGDMFVQYHEIESAVESLSLMAESLQNGNTFDWQVKTWGQATTGGTYSDGSSDWSDSSTFVASDTPVGTITDPTEVADYGYSSLEVDWDYTQADSSNQVEYLCKLYDEYDVLLETQSQQSEIATGGSDTATFDYVLENSTTYKVTLQVKSAAGLWSEETAVEFDTDFYVPPTPTISLELDEDVGGINITITNPSPVGDEVEAVYNKVYRSVDDGDWELIIDNVDINTTVTDYTAGIGNNNNYYVSAISATPSSANSSESDLDVEMTGYYFINGGNGYEDYIKLRGDTSIDTKFGRDTAVKHYHGRYYPLKNQGENLFTIINFSCDLPKTDYETIKSIIETSGNHFFRSYEGTHLQCSITNSGKQKKDNAAYQFSCTIERVDSSG